MTPDNQTVHNKLGMYAFAINGILNGTVYATATDTFVSKCVIKFIRRRLDALRDTCTGLDADPCITELYEALYDDVLLAHRRLDNVTKQRK